MSAPSWWTRWPPPGRVADRPVTPSTPSRRIFAAVERCRYAWSVLYDPALPPAGETRDAVNLYRGRLAAMGAAGAAQLLIHAVRPAGDRRCLRSRQV